MDYFFEGVLSDKRLIIGFEIKEVTRDLFEFSHLGETLIARIQIEPLRKKVYIEIKYPDWRQNIKKPKPLLRPQTPPG